MNDVIISSEFNESLKSAIEKLDEVCGMVIFDVPTTESLDSHDGGLTRGIVDALSEIRDVLACMKSAEETRLARLNLQEKK